MSGSFPQVQCGTCSAPIDEPSDAPSEKRAPCPACGSITRRSNMQFSETVTLHASLGYRPKSRGKEKPYLEGRTGDDFDHKTGEWMILERIMDRARNWYKALVTDPETGKVVHRCEEPLSQHRDHGSARPKNEPRSD